ncbi:hypothetical protein KKF86_08025 [bacterium]|nr:hypothetical protein [bacterium]
MVKKTYIESLRQFFQFGVSIIIAVTLALLSLDKYDKLLKEDIFHGILSIALFVVTFFWFIAWIYFDQKELQIFEDHINTDKLKRLNFGTFLNCLLITILCGVLLATSDKLLFYLIVVIINAVITTIAYYIVHYKSLKIYNDPKEENNKGQKIILEYYIYRPFSILDFLMIFLLLSSLALLILSSLTNNNNYFYFAYILCILTIIFHELIIWSWRIKRDKKLLELEDKTI